MQNICFARTKLMKSMEHKRERTSEHIGIFSCVGITATCIEIISYSGPVKN